LEKKDAYKFQVIDEYKLFTKDKLILIFGSKSSGGFVVSRQGLICESIMKGLLIDHPEFRHYSLPEVKPVKWKGRYYSWVKINKQGISKLPGEALNCFNVKEGDRLLSIHGSNVGFVLAVKGPLVEAANNFTGEIKDFVC